jgi:hypothetical protein
MVNKLQKKQVVEFDSPKYIFIGLVTQKLPHEIILLMEELFQLKFTMMQKDDKEFFLAQENNVSYVLLTKSFIKDYDLDYIFIIIPLNDSFNDEEFVNKIKETKKLQGIYKLNVSKKVMKELIHNLNL